MLKVGIYGASGYTGQELLRLLIRHPEVEVVALTSSWCGDGGSSPFFESGKQGC